MTQRNLVFDSRQFWWKKKLFVISTVMMLASVTGLGAVYGPLAAAEGRYWLAQRSKGSGGFGNLIAQKLEQEASVAPDAWFSLVIPKIQARSKVIANVDPGNRRAYLAALKQGVAHAAGTGLPGVASEVNRTIVLFAHSTDAPWNMARYNAVFYLLNKLEPGDKIEVYFQGVKHEYRVEELRVVSAQDVSYYEKQTKEEVLILQTCYPPGTTWKRLVVVARPV
jgi:LPXTG-site transpeptidase (sortase) family protein